jgi:hypothetical protein
MRKRRTRAALLVVLTAVVLSSAACDWPWTWKIESLYVHDTSVPYFGPEGYGTAPAVMKMWIQYYEGWTTSQADAWAYLAARGATNGDSGTSPDLFAYALNAYQAVYDKDATYNGGKSGGSQAVADIHKAIENNKPPAIVTWSGKYEMMKTYGASRWCNGFGKCQPSYDWVRVHIPADGGGESHYLTIADLLFDLGNPIRVFYRDWWDFGGMTNQDWAEYDGDATTYYGDPNPPDPVYWYGGEEPPGCHNPNGEPCEASLTRPGDTGTTAKTPKGHLREFVPDPKTRPDIIADLVAGIKRTHLNQQPGLESLTLEDGKLKVGAIVKVRSVSEHPDYFILNLEDVSTHQPYAQATIHASGLLGAVRLASADDRPLAVTEPADAQAHALKKLGITAQGDAEPIFAYGDIGQLQFNPLFLLTDVSGRSIIITAEGRAFELTGQGKNLGPKAGETSLHGKHGEQLILRELAGNR